MSLRHAVINRWMVVLALALLLVSAAACTSTNDQAGEPAGNTEQGAQEDVVKGGGGYPGTKLATSAPEEPAAGYPADEGGAEPADEGDTNDQSGEEGEAGDGDMGANAELKPIDPDECASLADAIAAALGAEVASTDADFADYVTGAVGTGCLMSASGTGADFENVLVVADSIRTVLASSDWAENIQYIADGPTGTEAGFDKSQALCLLNVNWEPSEDADCPDDQPIADCELEPEQRLFSIELNCAQAVAVSEP
ncbi:MAG: hypothetical protein ACK2T6_00460 [Anaerolineae bacterium]